MRVVAGRYAVARCASAPDGDTGFMVARDSDEVTVIAEESELPRLAALSQEQGYRLLEIRVAAPFESVGFLAAVTRALAAAGISILVVSTYSKDYVLLKEESLASGVRALAGIGLPVSGP